MDPDPMQYVEEDETITKLKQRCRGLCTCAA